MIDHCGFLRSGFIYLFLVKKMIGLNFGFLVGHSYLKVFVQFLILYRSIIVVILEGHMLLGNMVKGCFCVDLFIFLSESISFYVRSVGLSII